MLVKILRTTVAAGRVVVENTTEDLPAGDAKVLIAMGKAAKADAPAGPAPMPAPAPVDVPEAKDDDLVELDDSWSAKELKVYLDDQAIKYRRNASRAKLLKLALGEAD